MKKGERQFPFPVPRSILFDRFDYYREVQLWPLSEVLDPNRWLRNFKDDEQEYALSLLNAFLFLSEEMCNALLRSAFLGISAGEVEDVTSISEAKSQWSNFVFRLSITSVEGEIPNNSDSGLTFARKARQVLGIREEQILSPKEAIESVLRDAQKVVVFVDDFVGSGNQMKETWEREYILTNGTKNSFKNIAESGVGRFIYIPLVCTWKGYECLILNCPELELKAAYSLEDTYSLFSDNSILWPEKLRSTAEDVLFEVSKRAGIVDNYEYSWKGFHELGLCLAFWNSVPDATLPLFFWEEQGWQPLIRRT